MTDLLLQIVLSALPVIMAITLHEAAHGLAALALGDDTALRRGRLSANPLRHIDPVGTLLVPAVLVVGQLLTLGSIGFLFGWAKPVPVNPARFRHPRQGMALVAAAGPAANFLLAWLAALTLHSLDVLPAWAADVQVDLIGKFILSNLVLGLFNLLPVPPLDGGRIAVGVLPLAWATRWARLERAGILIVLMVVFLVPKALAKVNLTFDPVGSLLYTVLPRAFHLVFQLAGLPV